MQLLDDEWIASFLHFGFVPAIHDELHEQSWAQLKKAPQSSPPDRQDEAELIARGIDALRAACEEPAPGELLVPLSGGLDSRVILFTLLERGLGERLTAVTFGTPGTLDFECACAVARHAGVRHETLDLTEVEIEQGDLEAAVRRGAAWTTVFEALYNHLIPLRFGPDATIWSGYMANTINGSRVAPELRHSWTRAVESFAAQNRFATSVDLDPPGFDASQALPASPLLDDTPLTFYEQLHLSFRYLCRYEPTILAGGYRYRTPFRDPAWVNYMLAAPEARRRDQRLFREIAQTAFPEACALPTKGSLGLALNAPRWRRELRRLPLRLRTAARRFSPRAAPGTDPRINYIDFSLGLRRREDLKAVVHDNLQGLKRRQLVGWIEIDRLWDEHQRWRADHADALILLATLEINLKVHEADGDPRSGPTQRGAPNG